MSSALRYSVVVYLGMLLAGSFGGGAGELPSHPRRSLQPAAMAASLPPAPDAALPPREGEEPR